MPQCVTQIRNRSLDWLVMSPKHLDVLVIKSAEVLKNPERVGKAAGAYCVVFQGQGGFKRSDMATL